MRILKKIISCIKNPKKILYYLDRKGLCRINDEEYIKMMYNEKFNTYPDLKSPKTFNEKLQWLKLYDRNDEYTKMVDKYEAKKYVREKIGEEYIIPNFGVWEKFDDIDFEKLPNQFVIKCTHDSGGLVICKDKAKLNIKEARKKINNCLKRNYYYPSREYVYKNIKPRIIAEKYITNGSEEELKDYKILVFNGKAKCSFVCSDRYNKEKGLAIDFFGINWKHMPVKRHYRNSDEEIQKPINYEKMIELSEKLAEGIPFVRVDFYEINKKIYFGELTFYPGAGLEEFEPVEYDKLLGDMLELPIKEMEAN